MLISYFIALCGGVLCVLAGIYDWDWFFNNIRARPFVKLLGRNGARLFYVCLGMFLIFSSFKLMGYGIV